jgi:hypothetical protein
MFANLQTRYVGLDIDVLHLYRDLDKVALEKLELERQIESFAPNLFYDRIILELAKERLEKFAFVGLVERLRESIQLLSYTFNWNLPSDYDSLNVGLNRPLREVISQEMLEIIHQNTLLDEELYQFATRLFERKYHQMVDDLVKTNHIWSRSQIIPSEFKPKYKP